MIGYDGERGTTVCILRTETTVLPGHRVEVISPEFPEGAKVEVVVMLPKKSSQPLRIATLDFLEKLPTGQRAFDAREEYERFLKEEIDSWER